jgi:hypothetical protein
MFLFNGKPIIIDSPFTVGDINYPPHWIRFATPEQRLAVGITEVPDPVRPDDRFYNVSATLNDHFQYDATPKDLGELKERFVGETKKTAHTMLETTDWMVIREVEEPGSLPADIKTYRKAVRTRSSEIEVSINACADVPALEALVTGDLAWPLTAEERAKREAQRAGETGKGARGTKTL